jgi:signal transduction histidine kinase
MITKPGIRRSVTASAAISLAAALFFGALILRSQLRSSLEQGISDQTETLADSFSEIVLSNTYLPVLDPPETVPAWIQVVENGTVIARTPNANKLTKAFAPIPPGDAAAVRQLSGLSVNSGERVIVATVPIYSNGRRLVVMVASPLDAAQITDAKVVRLLSIVFPVLVLLSSLIVWITAKRALRPVEAMTLELAAITTNDLTQRVKVPPTDDEVARLATAMNLTLDRLDKSVNRQRRFVGDASHELRSPLASLRNQLEASLLEHDDPAWHHMVNEMQIDHNRLERLVADLLLLARHDEGKRVVREPTDIGYLVRSEMARRPEVLNVKRIVEAQNHLVDASSDALIRILRNLVDNAERHASTYVHVNVTGSGDRENPTVVMVVENDGPEIAAAHYDQIFERFARLDASRSSDKGGSGLGLAIVADLIADLDGTITVESANPGARFVVTLPAMLSEETLLN